jgi:hypothetical protein
LTPMPMLHLMHMFVNLAGFTRGTLVAHDLERNTNGSQTGLDLKPMGFRPDRGWGWVCPTSPLYWLGADNGGVVGGNIVDRHDCIG